LHKFAKVRYNYADLVLFTKYMAKYRAVTQLIMYSTGLSNIKAFTAAKRVPKMQLVKCVASTR